MSDRGKLSCHVMDVGKLQPVRAPGTVVLCHSRPGENLGCILCKALARFLDVVV